MAAFSHRGFSSTYIVILLFFFAPRITAQCNAPAQSGASVHDLYAQQKWTDLIAAAQRLPVHSADVNFELGMALAHLERWDEARAALLMGRRQCPSQKRFSVELAGVAFQQKHYPEATHYIRQGLRLDPRDDYANDFAGTVYLMTDNVDAALKYWNRIHRPDLDNLQIDSQLHLHRLLLERAFVFSPQTVMLRQDLLTSEARLEALGIFPAYSIKLVARPDGRFDADFHAIERNGFGNGWLQSAISVFSGLPYETIYPSYFNIRRSAVNFDSLLRWDAQKRRVWMSLAWPVRTFPQWRWQLIADGRSENWAIRSSFTGTAPVLGSFQLKREVGGATITAIRSGRFLWSSGGELSHRTYGDVVSGSALTPSLVSPGYELKYVARAKTELLDWPEHRFNVSASALSEFGRFWSNPPRLFEKLQGTVSIDWLPQAEGDKYEFSQLLRGGGMVGTLPVDELWMIGVERDTDLWLRGHIGARDGRKGSSPMADRYFLSNSDFYRTLWGNGLINIKAGPLLDIARVAAPTSGLAPQQWLFDAGAEVKMSVLGTSVAFTFGRDLRTGDNAFYGTAAHH